MPPHHPSLSSRWFWLITALLLLLFLYLIKGILLPFVVGLGVAYFLDPAADRLEAWGLSRGLATVVITLLFFALVATGLATLLPVLYHQLASFVAEWPHYVDVAQQTYLPKFQTWLARLGLERGSLTSPETISGFSSDLARLSGGVFSGLLHSWTSLFSLASLIVLTPVVTFYLLRDWDRLVARTNALLPRAYAEVIREQACEIDRTLASFVRGQLNVCLLLGAFYAIGLSLVGLKFSLLIGLVAGTLVILPYVGTVVSATLSLGVAYVQFGTWEDVGIVAAIFIAGQMIEGYALVPKLVGSRVGLHPVWVIFGMLAGGALFGFVGVLLAVPVSAVIGVLMRFATRRYLDSEIYNNAS